MPVWLFTFLVPALFVFLGLLCYNPPHYQINTAMKTRVFLCVTAYVGLRIVMRGAWCVDLPKAVRE
jgi:hypothetical protein